MPIRLVVLDIAGTTVKDDNNVSEAFQQALQHYGYEVPEQVINTVMGYEKEHAIRSMLAKYEPVAAHITDKLVGAIHDMFVTNMMNWYETTPTLQFIPGVEAALAALRASGVRIGINTGFSRNIADTIVSRLRWREKGLLDYLVASDEVPFGRPYPFMIQQIMNEAGVTNSHEVAKAGDTEADVREGLNAGCRYVVGVTTGAFTREQLQLHHPTHIIDHLSELVNIIRHD